MQQIPTISFGCRLLYSSSFSCSSLTRSVMALETQPTLNPQDSDEQSKWLGVRLRDVNGGQPRAGPHPSDYLSPRQGAHKGMSLHIALPLPHRSPSIFAGRFFP